jgi:hypothetical protein
MKTPKILHSAGVFALAGAAMLLPGCTYEDYSNGGYGSFYSGTSYGDPYWGYGPWYVYDDDDDHHHHGDGGGDNGNRPGRPTHPIANPPDRGQRPSQLPSRSIPASAPRSSMGGGGGRGGGGGGRR